MLKKIAEFFEWIFFTIIIIIVLIIASPLLPTAKILRLQTYIVSSGSMEPTIKAGDLAFTVAASAKNLRENDIITFISPKDPKQTILHRINKIKNNRFETKGDNNSVRDIWMVTPELIRGKYLFSLPFLGHAAAFFKTPLGFSIIVGVPALIFIFFCIKQINEGINEEVEKRVGEKNTPLQS